MSYEIGSEDQLDSGYVSSKWELKFELILINVLFLGYAKV